MYEIYIRTDIETDGPIPGPHSMLSIGSAAYTSEKALVSTFSANLETLPGAQAHPKTAQWWATQPEAWAACRKDLERPEQAMTQYVNWIKSLDGKPVFFAYPAGFDFIFANLWRGTDAFRLTAACVVISWRASASPPRCPMEITGSFAALVAIDA